MNEDIAKAARTLDRVAARSDIPVNLTLAGEAARMIPSILELGELYSDGEAIGLELAERRLEVRGGMAFLWYPEGNFLRAVAVYDVDEKVRIATAIMARAEEGGRNDQ